MSSVPSDFVVTHEHQRFAEFCDACRRYHYIGVCYGAPGVGKSLSAQHYANWFHLQAYASYAMTSVADFATVAGSTTVFYTPAVVNAPQRIAQLTSRTLFSGSMMVFEEYSRAKHGMVL